MQQKFFHPGEVEVQVASGSDPVQYERWAVRTLTPDFTEKEAHFVENCSFAAAASVDEVGRPWASAFFTAGSQLFTVKSSSVVSIACSAGLATATESRVLSKADRAQLSQSDTAFLASFYPDHGADVTHRGGNPGFLRVLGETSLEIPDYTGNGMFNTLENLKVDSRLALTEINFSSGRTLHLTGSATISDDVDPRWHPGASRVITFEVEQVVVSHAHVGTWVNLKASPYNPSLPGI